MTTIRELSQQVGDEVELRGWLAQSGTQVLAMSSVNSLSTTWSERLTEVRQDEAAWAKLLEWEVEASAEPGALDMGTHIIAVVKKRASGLLG